MMKNPQAFPATQEIWYEEKRTGEIYHSGMTLRDYFAGQALVTKLRNAPNFDYESIADESYKIADAMLKRRNEYE